MEYLQQLYTKVFGDAGGMDGDNTTPRKIVCIGNVLIDRTAKLPDTQLLEKYQLPLNSHGVLDTETLVKITADACKIVECETNPGGSALNTVRILKRFGTDALFVGAIGEDENGRVLQNILKERHVTARLNVISDTPTGQCIALVCAEGTALYADIGASAKLTIDHLKQAECDENLPLIRAAERKQIFYIEGFFIPDHDDFCDYLIKHYIQGRHYLATNLNAVYVVEENFELILKLVASALFVFGNHIEFGALMKQMGCESLEEMGRQLLKGDTPKIILVSKGADGLLLITNFVEEQAGPGDVTFQSFNAPRVDVVDPTGAGDALAAGFLHAWLEKRNLSECVRVGMDVAARVCTQIGCNLSEEDNCLIQSG